MISTTAAAPEFAALRLLDDISDAYARMEEFTPLSVVLRQSVSEQIHLRTLSLYKLAGEK